MRIEIMDTTLRDGEQMQGISYTPVEKLHITAFLLKEVNNKELTETLFNQSQH